MAFYPGTVNAHEIVLPFDGEATPGEIVVASDAAAPAFGPGYASQAIYFSGKSAVAVPAVINPGSTPQISITAWIKRSPASKHGWFIDSGSNASLPSLRLQGGMLGARAGRDVKIMSVENALIAPDEWTFVAGVWDFTAHTLRLYKGDLSQDFDKLRMDLSVNGLIGKQKTVAGPDGKPATFVTIGAQDFINFGGDVKGLAIDEVRIYTRALNDQEIATLAAGGTLAPEEPDEPEGDAAQGEGKPAPGPSAQKQSGAR